MGRQKQTEIMHRYYQRLEVYKSISSSYDSIWEEQNWSSLDSFQAILRLLFSCQSAAITWTSESFGFCSVFLICHLFKAGTEGEPNSNFRNDCSKTGYTQSGIKQQNSCDDMFSAEDTYVQARWWLTIIIIKKNTNCAWQEVQMP